MLAKILRKHGFEVYGVGCKVGTVPKVDVGIPKKCEGVGKTMCNPILQAKLLNEEQTDLNVVVGLCVGQMCIRDSGGLLSGIIDQDMLDSVTSGIDLDADGMKDAKIPCVIDIYQDSILPARIYIDMKDVLAKLMGDEYEGLEVDEYYVELTYNEYDKADEIKVPKKAKEAADAGGGLDWDSGDDDNGKAKTAPAKQSKELGDKWDSYTVQIGEKVVTLPLSLIHI